MKCVCVCVSLSLQESGLSLWVAELLTPLGDLPVLATITVACIIVTTVTEVASNAATITIFLPILSPLVGSPGVFMRHGHCARRNLCFWFLILFNTFSYRSGVEFLISTLGRHVIRN